jgi:hypothetical protein
MEDKSLEEKMSYSKNYFVFPILLCTLTLVGCGDEEVTAPTAVDCPAHLQIVSTRAQSLVLNWHDHSDDNEGFILQRVTGDHGVFATIDTLPANQFDYIDIGLTARQEYTYRVCAFNSIGQSEYSNEANGSTTFAYTVMAGIENHYSNGRDNAFRFTSGPGFALPGTLTVAGPEEWNDGEVFTSLWSTTYIGFNRRGAVSGTFEINWCMDGVCADTTLYVDATLILEKPVITVTDQGGGNVHVSWHCEGAERWSFGCDFAEYPFSAGASTASTDTTLTGLESGMEYWILVSAFAETETAITQFMSSAERYTLVPD